MTRLAPPRRVLLAALAGVATLAAGCGGAQAPNPAAAAMATTTATASPSFDAAQVRADAFATVASRLYAEEAVGPAGQRNAARIARDQRFLRALQSGQNAAIRAAALRELFLPVKHVVRIGVVRAGRTVVDVGGSFVSGAESTELRAPDGASLGRLDISMQDILGLTKLVTRFTGAQIVVHGRPGHVVASSPALADISMPASGRVTVGGRPYAVRTLTRTGFAGEPLKISVLVPA
jgi:hypothetical protein